MQQYPNQKRVYSGYFGLEGLGCGDSHYDPTFLTPEEAEKYCKSLLERPEETFSVDNATPTIQEIRDRLYHYYDPIWNHDVQSLYLREEHHFIESHQEDRTKFSVNTASIVVCLGGVWIYKVKANDGTDVIEIPLRPGSLFCLGPKTSATYRHSILNTDGKEYPRIILKFCSVQYH